MPDNNDPVYIDTLEIENVKRIKAFKMECDGRALTVIGGRNLQGKTTTLDSVAFVLGGEKYRPTNLKRDDSLADPQIKVKLSNGLIAERKGKNAALKVIDPEGNLAGQALLKEFIPQFALDLPSFLNARGKERTEILLKSRKELGDKLKKLESEEEKYYNERLVFGRIADQKKKYADELITYPDAPDTPITASELIHEQQEILARNGENQRLRNNADKLEDQFKNLSSEVNKLAKELAIAQGNLLIVTQELQTARKTAQELEDESTAEIEAKLNEIDAINVQVRANMDKENANEEAQEHTDKYDEMTQKIDKIREDKMELLKEAKLPLPELSIENGELTYNGKAWDCMGGSEQLRVAVAIVGEENPNCGFVLIDKSEAYDLQTLHEFGQWLEKKGLQAIATRVSQGDECSIIIEDGFSVEGDKKTFVRGEF